MSTSLTSMGKRKTPPRAITPDGRPDLDDETAASIAWIRRRSRELQADPVKARKYLIEIGALPDPS
jgi:hypothetical protein